MWSHPPISYDHFNHKTKTFCKNITANLHQQSHHTDGAAAANTLVVKLRSVSWWSVWLQPKHLCEMCQLKNLSMNSWFTAKSPVFNVMWRSKTQEITHQSQHARRLFDGSAASQETHHHHQSPCCDQDVHACNKTFRWERGKKHSGVTCAFKFPRPVTNKGDTIKLKLMHMISTSVISAPPGSKLPLVISFFCFVKWDAIHSLMFNSTV